MSGPRPSGPLRAPLHRIDARSRLRVANSVLAQDPHPRSPHGTGWGWGASVGVDRAHSRVRAIILITLNRLNSPRPPGGLGISDVTIRATGREHRFRRRGVFRGCLGCFPWVSYVRWPGRPSSNIGRTKRRTGGRTMREIGLVLLSIAMMALLRTDADAKRRSSAQGARRRGPAEAGARSTLGTAARTAAIRRSINAFASARNRPAGEGRVDRRIRYPRAR